MALEISCSRMSIVFACASLANLGTQWLLNHGRSLNCNLYDMFTPEAVENRCKSSLYGVLSAFEDGAHVILPGIAPLITNLKDQELKYYPGYHGLAFLLLLNAAIFLVPKFLRPQYTIKQTNQSNVYRPSGSELLCILLWLAQFWMIDTYLGGGFATYGYQVFLRQFFPGNPLTPTFDPMIRMFPDQANCLIKYLSIASASPTNFESKHVTCELFTNRINALIYLIVWYCLAMQLLLFATFLFHQIYMFVRTLVPGRARLPKARKIQDDRSDN